MDCTIVKCFCRQIYSALPVEQSCQYQVVKEAVLKAYELVPEAYRQKFCTSVKEEKQTYVEFACLRRGSLIDGVPLRTLMESTLSYENCF